jgi:hypothetical protein
MAIRFIDEPVPAQPSVKPKKGGRTAGQTAASVRPAASKPKVVKPITKKRPAKGEGKFDRKAYQRDLMRKRRAAAKGKT